MNRIEAAFIKQQRPIFIGYLMAGHPSLEQTPALIKAMEEGGADMVEIGIPYSDPLADGPIIQQAGQMALQNGSNPDLIFEMLPAVRTMTGIPLLLMVYYSTLFRYGTEKFLARCRASGIDGLIVPDLPLEEQHEMIAALEGKGIAWIPLVAPTSNDRIARITAGAKGFVYCVSTLGVTGTDSRFCKDIEAYLTTVKEVAGLPVAVGFGISSHEDIVKLGPYADGIIVGSALVKSIGESGGDAEVLKELIKSLRGAK